MTENDNRNDALHDPSRGRPILRRREVASMFGVTERTIFNWEKAGHLHPRRVGRTVFYLSDEVERLGTLGPGCDDG